MFNDLFSTEASVNPANQRKSGSKYFIAQSIRDHTG